MMPLRRWTKSLLRYIGTLAVWLLCGRRKKAVEKPLSRDLLKIYRLNFQVLPVIHAIIYGECGNFIWCLRNNEKLAPLVQEINEIELERAIMNKVNRFLIELGGAFTFVGNQFRLEIEGREFFIDILLYHRRLQNIRLFQSFQVRLRKNSRRRNK